MSSQSQPIETEKALALAKRALHRVNELEERVKTLEVENDGLRADLKTVEHRIDELEERDILTESVIDAKRLKVEERAAICIETTANKALRRKRRGEKAVATMDYNDADAALGGKLERRQLIDALERGADLVEGDTVQYVSEPRGSNRNSRLIVDLQNGQLPESIAGVALEVES